MVCELVYIHRYIDDCYSVLFYYFGISIKFLFTILSVCPQVTVTAMDHVVAGDNGQYFSFSKGEMDEMMGNNEWYSAVIGITQEGSRNWNGNVRLWNNLNGKKYTWLTGKGVAK